MYRQQHIKLHINGSCCCIISNKIIQLDVLMTVHRNEWTNLNNRDALGVKWAIM